MVTANIWAQFDSRIIFGFVLLIAGVAMFVFKAFGEALTAFLQKIIPIKGKQALAFFAIILIVAGFSLGAWNVVTAIAAKPATAVGGLTASSVFPVIENCKYVVSNAPTGVNYIRDDDNKNVISALVSNASVDYSKAVVNVTYTCEVAANGNTDIIRYVDVLVEGQMFESDLDNEGDEFNILQTSNVDSEYFDGKDEQTVYLAANKQATTSDSKERARVKLDKGELEFTLSVLAFVDSASVNELKLSNEPSVDVSLLQRISSTDKSVATIFVKPRA